ncbi:MAG: hypothetical protein Q7R85_02160 [bacterium]|nr:hypothetical protein [bacterium]
MGSPTLATFNRMVREGQPNAVTNERLVKLVESGLWDVAVDAPDYGVAAATLRGGEGIVMIPLTPTTFGPLIQPPFVDEGGWDLIADGPDELDIANVRQLPMLEGDETVIKYEEAVRRSREFGQRAAFRIRDAGNAGKISKEVFPVDTYAPCGKTVWRHRQGGRCYAWYVDRDASGFCCLCGWFSDVVDSSSRRLVSK